MRHHMSAPSCPIHRRWSVRLAGVAVGCPESCDCQRRHDQSSKGRQSKVCSPGLPSFSVPSFKRSARGGQWSSTGRRVTITAQMQAVHWPTPHSALLSPMQMVEALALQSAWSRSSRSASTLSHCGGRCPCVAPNPSVKGTSRKRAAPYVER
jgi:hypothetical protein